MGHLNIMYSMNYGLEFRAENLLYGKYNTKIHIE